MTSSSGTRKTLALFVAIVTLAGAVAFGLVSVTRPTPFSSATLGAEWQCHRTAFIMTTCRRAVRTEPVVVNSIHPICLRRA